MKFSRLIRDHITNRARISLISLLLAVLSFPSVPGYVLAENVNELPMFGGVQKSPEMLEADRKFVESAVIYAGSREEAAKLACGKAWELLQKNDNATAMRRFNQAWLLDSDNPDIFWGFGILTGRKGEFAKSVEFLEKAVSMRPDDGKILADLAFSEIWHGISDAFPNDEAKQDNLKKVVALFQKAETLGEPNKMLYQNWAIALFYLEDFKGAMDKIEKQKHICAACIDQRFVADLAKALYGGNGQQK